MFVGRELIITGQLRSQLNQFENYQRAVGAFKLKYNCLPGDCRTAAQLGFKPRGIYLGTGDGNGIMQGNYGGYTTNNRGTCQNGENLLFWVDLTTAGVISESFTTAIATAPIGNITTSAELLQLLPAAKAASNNYMYVFSDSGINYFGLSGATSLDISGYNIGLGVLSTTRALSPLTAGQLDQKIDDGMPLTGKLTARYISPTCSPATIIWSATASSSVAAAGSASTCYDNNADTANPVIYTTRFNSGNGLNCAISMAW